MEIGKVYRRKNGSMMADGIPHFRHYFACIVVNESKCCGVMITSRDYYENNVSFDPSHIAEGYEFKYDNSYFMAQSLDKNIADVALIECGYLTEKGVSFVLDSLPPGSMPWYSYEKNRRSGALTLSGGL